MELVIPFIALGGMYVVSNQKKKNRSIEPYTNMDNSVMQEDEFQIANENHNDDHEEIIGTSNTTTDKYFNQNTGVFNSNESQKMAQAYSLSGNFVDLDKFKHNNMVPFNGKKVKGQLYNINAHESLLDNKIGSGSQVFKKVEQAPLFKPEDNVQWSHGVPNQSDFFQSRVNPSLKKNNMKPFESERVGPGLGQGFTGQASGGFNSGMESRDQWMPKTINDLRVESNPRIEYELRDHEGPADSNIKRSGLIGRVEKQRPDTYFEQDEGRWLTTTGSEKGETLRPEQQMGILRRADTMSNYAGPAVSADIKAGYAPKNFETTRRTQLGGLNVTPSNAVGAGPMNDQQMKGYKNYGTHRSASKQPDTFRSGFGGAIGAVVAPLMDILRPSRKEESIQNIRIYGEAGTSVPQNYVLNPSDVTSTTIKETTMYSPEFNINNQHSSMYVDTHRPIASTQRDSTSTNYIGGARSSYGEMIHDSQRTQNNTKSATIHNRMAPGSMNLFNSNLNVNIVKQDTSPLDYRANAPAAPISRAPSNVTYGKTIHRQAVQTDPSRMDGDLLSAFKANPYTHSLSSAV
jgi:hypothetical protein